MGVDGFDPRETLASLREPLSGATPLNKKQWHPELGPWTHLANDANG